MSNIQFMEENKSKARIKVIGVGGCGGNTLNSMIANSSLDNKIDLYAINTDVQALDRMSDGVDRIQIGQQITKGLGVGADYNKAREAALLDRERMEELVSGSDMVFIAAGMGGGTGTGAAPVIAEICREQSILTVAVVTKPFMWENRDANTDYGIKALGDSTDSIIIVPNDRICEVYGNEITTEQALEYSDLILSNAVAGICEIIYNSGRINVDFEDVKTVMSEMGQAMIGTATEEGIDRASMVARQVTACPLLEGIELSNARGLLVNITANPKEFKMNEINEVMTEIKGTAANDAKVFFGMVDDEGMGDKVRVTLVATGLNQLSGAGKPTMLAQYPTRASGGAPTAPGGGRPNFMRSNRQGSVGRGAASNQGTLLGEGEDKTPTALRKQYN